MRAAGPGSAWGSMRLEEPRHVGIVVDREAVGMRRDDRIQRPRESFQGLMRQPIDEIDVDRAEARRAARLDDAERLLHTLNAIDGLLHLGVEVLYAEARAVESEVSQGLDVRGRGEPGVELDREIELGLAAEAEAPDEAPDEPRQIGLTQEVGCPAAEVQLAHFAMVMKERRDHGDFNEQPLDIATTRADITRDQPIAAAVEAGACTERNVDIEGQGPGGERRIAAPRVLAVVSLARIPAGTAAPSDTTYGAGPRHRIEAASPHRFAAAESG
jgi:hypothetical protein